MEYIIIIIFVVFVNNIVFAQFLGICPLLGVSTRISTSAGMAGAVLFVLTLATIVTWLVFRYVLLPFNITFLQTIAFILVIAALVQMVEIILKKVSPALYQALGIYLPLITTNCAVLAVAIQTGVRELALLQAVVFAISNALGFGLALLLFAGIREHLALVGVPKGMQGVPIALVIAGILSMAFMGFANLVSW
jgi:electron transport complex protein RnfA